MPSFAFRAVPATLDGYKGSVLDLGAADGVTVLSDVKKVAVKLVPASRSSVTLRGD